MFYKLFGALWIVTTQKNTLMDSFLLKVDSYPDFDVRWLCLSLCGHRLVTAPELSESNHPGRRRQKPQPRQPQPLPLCYGAAG